MAEPIATGGSRRHVRETQTYRDVVEAATAQVREQRAQETTAPDFRVVSTQDGLRIEDPEPPIQAFPPPTLGSPLRPPEPREPDTLSELPPEPVRQAASQEQLVASNHKVTSHAERQCGVCGYCHGCVASRPAIEAAP